MNNKKNKNKMSTQALEGVTSAARTIADELGVMIESAVNRKSIEEAMALAVLQTAITTTVTSMVALCGR